MKISFGIGLSKMRKVYPRTQLLSRYFSHLHPLCGDDAKQLYLGARQEAGASIKLDGMPCAKHLGTLRLAGCLNGFGVV